MPRVIVAPAKARRISWRAYLVRFVFGGLVTLIAGVIGKVFGVTVGGLFLAFPSIAVASLTLVERDNGKNAVGADAAGTSLGSIGLLAFGAVVWILAPSLPAWLVLGIALLIWFVLSSGLWLCWWWARHR
jgi:uncharacterized membrane protein (GlpM family)